MVEAKARTVRRLMVARERAGPLVGTRSRPLLRPTPTSPLTKPKQKPYAGNPHVRFDEGLLARTSCTAGWGLLDRPLAISAMSGIARRRPVRGRRLEAAVNADDFAEQHRRLEVGGAHQD